MLYIIAYDIREPKRLRKVAKTCEDYGIRVEYSVFECDFSEEIFREFWDKLKLHVDEDEDSLLAYRICGSCVQKIESSGAVVRPGKPLLYFM
ncbi:MAG TPA: CRISPR-associated endonuclease Cas2 [Lentisphaeria bacterium]|nr:MAG: CRISPR-associated endonuclease Cas2 [Lentisphaerae bacterium GWF2_38_69]HBM15073.1 CRISPR-associated endonuclease Cas2 [Lentisphaeria bacterium]